MYYPYFRGRQNELLCLREMLEQNKLSDKIIPIVEPVRCNNTFFSTLETFIKNDRTIVIIQNPEVGRYHQEFQTMLKTADKAEDEKSRKKAEEQIKKNLEILKDRHLIPAYLMGDKVVNDIFAGDINKENVILINKGKENYNYYVQYGEKICGKITIIPNDMDFKDELAGDAVVLEDAFNKAKRNADYSDCVDEFFSKNHITYKKRGYQGFADYSVVGDIYEESGFSPLAIAIHIVYFDEKKMLQIHHFVSDTNEKSTDLPRKFEEAMEKLQSWELLGRIKMTAGLSGLFSYYRNGRFPGLGLIKKYSLMHHMELMSDYLGENA